MTETHMGHPSRRITGYRWSTIVMSEVLLVLLILLLLYILVVVVVHVVRVKMRRGEHHK